MGGRRRSIDLIRHPESGSSTHPVAPSTRATTGAIYESTPVWSPDASHFVFAAARDTPPNLYLKRIGGPGEDERLFRTTLQSFPQSWSRDGRYLSYVTIDPKTSADIWLVPMTGDRKPEPFLQTPFYESHPRISPDGRWLAYSSNETGRQDVYVTTFPSPGRKWPVSTNGWGVSGMAPGRPRAVLSRGRWNRSRLSRSVPALISRPARPIPLFKPPANIGGLGLGTFYDVAPDGRFLVNVFVERTSPPATVVLNWRPDSSSSRR